ncbi:CHAD domain-containing protein [Pseudomonas sp.]|uniref:CHAD domain-containing protein n=1 Tax=Pseudomonas sp. TaxID=306 RepID=UPI00272BB5DF|nr:CHAD domain-containing protein [Pseudomonas sp.]
MASQIRPGRSASKEVQRIARKRLAKARDALNSPPRQRDKGVHQARKRIKELRALLRLVRKPLGKRYRVENHRLRDAARLLSELRDSAAQVEAWDALMAHTPDVPDAMAEIRQRLAERPANSRRSANQALGEALAMLDEVEAAVVDWPLPGKGFALFQASLQKTLRDGHAALELAEREPTAHHLHEWRKRVKDQWYQTRYLGLAWPEYFDLRTAQLKELAQLLGDDHDLFMLQQRLVSQPTLFGDEPTREQVALLIVARRAGLQAEAFRLGRRLYAESPRALRRRWRTYWALARLSEQ